MLLSDFCGGEEMNREALKDKCFGDSGNKNVSLQETKFFSVHVSFLSFFRFYLFTFREERERRKREKHQCVVAFHGPPTGDLAHNRGMCPDWESNQWPFGSQADTQSTEPHQPGPYIIFKSITNTREIIPHFSWLYKNTLDPWTMWELRALIPLHSWKSACNFWLPQTLTTVDSLHPQTQLTPSHTWETMVGNAKTLFPILHHWIHKCKTHRYKGLSVNWKKCVYKWTRAVQNCAIQG